MLVVGDVMLDSYIWGTSSRISPEAPVPVINAIGNSRRPGGAANVACILAALGAKVTLTGYYGCDNASNELSILLDANKVKNFLIRDLLDKEYKTTIKERVFADGVQIARIDDETIKPITLSTAECILNVVKQNLKAKMCDAIVLSDYAKGVLTPYLCTEIIHQASQANIPVIVDPKAQDFALKYCGATVVCPNKKELAEITGYGYEEGAEKLASDYSIKYVVATLSDAGILLVDSELPNAPKRISTKTRMVRDVCGAGDVVTSVIALALASSGDIESAALLANSIAGLSVEKVGTSTVTREEVIHSLLYDVGTKVISHVDVKWISESWRSHSKVVFTNGCFDMLHAGHVDLLNRARQLGDYLIVGLNSDKSIRKLKGLNRPIINERDRAAILSALSCVDAVVIVNSEEELWTLINTVKPHCLVKGSEYEDHNIVGSNDLVQWGGKLILLNHNVDYTTTQTIDTILSRF